VVDFFVKKCMLDTSYKLLWHNLYRITIFFEETGRAGSFTGNLLNQIIISL